MAIQNFHDLLMLINTPPFSLVRRTRGREKRVHTQGRHLENLILLLHDLPQSYRFLQLGFPLQLYLGGLSK